MIEYNYESEFVNASTGFMLRYVYSETERFVKHWHDYYETFLVLEGEITHEINGKSQHLTEGALVFIRPGDIHRYICNYGKCRFLNLTFSKKTMNDLTVYLGEGFNDELMFKSTIPPLTMISPVETDRIFRKFQQINTIELNDKVQFRLHMRAYLAELISTYFFHTPYIGDSASDRPFWLESLCAQMNLKENFVAGTAKMLELSGRTREHLSRSVKKYCGVTPSEYVNNLRLNYAANMLINSNMSVIDICYDCGFDNAGYFYKKFKLRYGNSPLKFREENGRRC